MLVIAHASQSQGLERYKLMQKAWSEAQARREPFMKRMCARSYMNTNPTQSFFRMAAEGDFKVVSKEMLDMVGGIFMFGQTKLIEDAWQKMKTSERRDNDNSAMSNSRKWFDPVKNKVASSVHRFPEISAQDAPPPQRGDPGKLKPGLFKPLRRETTTSFKDIVSTKQPASWTVGPASPQ